MNRRVYDSIFAMLGVAFRSNANFTFRAVGHPMPGLSCLAHVMCSLMLRKALVGHTFSPRFQAHVSITIVVYHLT